MSGRGMRPIWILLVLAVLGVWLVYVPRRPARLFDAVPANALFVSHHSRVAQRWDRISACPPLRPALTSCGLLVGDEKSGWRTPPEVARWIRRLASDRVVLAYSPRLGAQDRPAWIGAAWIGGRARWLHWMVRLGLLKGIREDRQDLVHRFWVAGLGDAGHGPFLSFGFQEGLVIACLSPDPEAVRTVLIQMDRRRPESQTDRFPLPGGAALGDRRYPDIVWIQKPGASRTDPDRLCAARLERLDAGGVSGSLFLPPWPAPDAQWCAESEADLIGLLSDSPAIWFKAPHTLWPVLEKTWILPAPVRMIGAAVLPAPAVSPRPVYGGLLNTNYDMRLKGPFRNIPLLGGNGLKLPTALLAVPMFEGEGVALGQIMGLLDRLNARQGWGLIPHPLSVQGRTLTLIEESRPNFYGQFELDERAALVPLGHTLLIGSNAGNMRRLLNAAPAAGITNTWQILTGPAVLGGIWVQGAAAWPVIRNLLGATMLSQSLSSSPAAAETRRRMGTWIRWWDGCRTLDHAAVIVRADPAGGPAQADFSILFTPLE